MATDLSSSKWKENAFLLSSLVALFIVFGLYAEEAIHFYFYRHTLMTYPLNSPDCRQINGDPGFAWCNAAGYGWTKFQKGSDHYSYVDPSSPKLSSEEVNARDQVYREMFE